MVKYLDSTSPEPKPPFIVSLAPEPINNTLPGLLIGNSSFLFKNRVHSEADSLRFLCADFHKYLIPLGLFLKLFDHRYVKQKEKLLKYFYKNF